jgi:hypothetical protein
MLAEFNYTKLFVLPGRLPKTAEAATRDPEHPKTGALSSGPGNPSAAF